MGSELSKFEILELVSNSNQYKERNSNEEEFDFVGHTKKAVLIAINEELTEKQRLYFTMFYLQNMTETQIAESFGIHKSTVCRTLQRAKVKISKVVRYSAPHLLNAPIQKRNRRVKDG